jgi:ribonuclease P protein subunit POP4
VKDSSVFHFKFPDGTVVEIDGKLLVGRPEDRLKKRVRRLW